MRDRKRLGNRAKTYTGMGRGRHVVECFSLGFSPEDGHLSRMKRFRESICVSFGSRMG